MKINTMLYITEIDTSHWSEADHEAWQDMTARERNYFVGDLLESKLDVLHCTPTIFRQIQSVE